MCVHVCVCACVCVCVHSHLLAQLGCELEPLFVSHVVQEEGVDLHPLHRTLGTFEAEQGLLSLRLPKPVVHCNHTHMYNSNTVHILL